MSEIRVPLTTPIRVIDTEVTELVFAMPRGRHAFGLPNPDTNLSGWAVVLASKCVINAPARAVLNLLAYEARRVAKVVGDEALRESGGADRLYAASHPTFIGIYGLAREIRVPLTLPIRVIDKELTELIFEAPTGDNIAKISRPEADRCGYAIELASMCVRNAPAEAVLDLPVFEAMRVGRLVFEATLPTQASSSSTSISSAPAAGETSAQSSA